MGIKQQQPEGGAKEVDPLAWIDKSVAGFQKQDTKWLGGSDQVSIDMHVFMNSFVYISIHACMSLERVSVHSS